jgi:tRNA-dihydrouridine synthase 4
MIQPYCDGVNLNCGCPQKWASKEGIGAIMINKSDLICEIVKDAKRRLNHNNEFTVSVKIRIHDKLE